MLPRINEAFARPLYHLEAAALRDQILTQSQQVDDNIDAPDPTSDLSTDDSVMEVSSISASSSDSDLISVDSYQSIT